MRKGYQPALGVSPAPEVRDDFVSEFNESRVVIKTKQKDFAKASKTTDSYRTFVTSVFERISRG